MRSNRRGFLAMTIWRWALLPLCLWLSAASAHQEPCHRLHACSSDHNTAEHAIAHGKIIVIDGETIITGSFNFTKAAQEKNGENLLLIRYQALAAQYTQNWEAHRQHSQPYVGQGVVW
jgi:phosphatidylserine/phosphatidylglycerophosphate/cardiolipin synthase-like enzyme